jgi:hypothetical protein
MIEAANPGNPSQPTGTAVTVLTYEAASGGGTYVVVWGAILFGAIQAIRGLAMLGRKPQQADLLKAFSLYDGAAFKPRDGPAAAHACA